MLRLYGKYLGVIIGLDPIIQMLSKYSWIPVGMYPRENGDGNDTYYIFVARQKVRQDFIKPR